MPKALYEVILPDRARAEADDLDSALLAARTLATDAAIGLGGARLFQREIIVISNLADGLTMRYDGIATALAHERI